MRLRESILIEFESFIPLCFFFFIFFVVLIFIHIICLYFTKYEENTYFTMAKNLKQLKNI